MSENTERPPKNVLLPYVSKFDSKSGGAFKFFDDPDCIGAEFEIADDGTRHEIGMEWAAKEMGMRATLSALRDVLTQGDYEGGKAFILRENAHFDESLQFFSRSNERRKMIAGGEVVRLEGESQDIAAEIFDDDDGRIHAFGFDNGQLEVSYHRVWPKTFHDIPTMGIFLHETGEGGITRMVVDECIAATARKGLLANVDVTLDEFSEYIPGLKR